MAADRHVVDLQQRRPAAGEPEQALEGDRVVEVAAHGQQRRSNASIARELALAQAQPGGGVGARW